MKGVVTEKPKGAPKGTPGEYLDRLGAHVYFGGLHEADGEGHGHGWIDANGTFSVFRDPYDPAVNGARARATGEYDQAVAPPQ
jgi:hypothetical protein